MRSPVRPLRNSAAKVIGVALSRVQFATATPSLRIQSRAPDAAKVSPKPEFQPDNSAAFAISMFQNFHQMFQHMYQAPPPFSPFRGAPMTPNFNTIFDSNASPINNNGKRPAESDLRRDDPAKAARTDDAPVAAAVDSTPSK